MIFVSFVYITWLVPLLNSRFQLYWYYIVSIYWIHGLSLCTVTYLGHPFYSLASPFVPARNLFCQSRLLMIWSLYILMTLLLQCTVWLHTPICSANTLRSARPTPSSRPLMQRPSCFPYPYCVAFGWVCGNMFFWHVYSLYLFALYLYSAFMHAYVILVAYGLTFVTGFVYYW